MITEVDATGLLEQVGSADLYLSDACVRQDLRSVDDGNTFPRQTSRDLSQPWVM